MNAFYNDLGIGDVLLISLKEIEKEKRVVERKGDVARLYHKDSGETAGYHIFQATRYGTVEGRGMLPITNELKELLQKALEENGFQEQIQFPTQPAFVVGFVKDKKKHPDADKLSVCQVDTGEETLQIVCGAPNVDKGQKVPVALTGAVMPTGMKIKKSKLRGVPSNGMICSAKELAIADAPQEKGILVLEDKYEVGIDFLLQKQRLAH
ncbi:YtpR family tRNA-binding protein [Alteribacillus iranensis]|uniref:tRNA-binding protein n=1 Tax=Alteribacillus iranensis TaxID=930128 RepID=A0A1I2ETL2_9BACI|nr:DUF4479 family protein [Alteribacillus iranensis]SFE95661.1 tRNA-binding protein [Alteribacillus iranensis]